MSANTSQRKARALVMERLVEHHRELALVLECRPCQRQDTLELDDYVGITMHQLLTRLRCPGCGQEPSVATLTDPQGRRPLRLLGPSAYA